MSDFQHAQLDWDEHGQPLSRGFGDVYFSRASGLEETRYVFLAHNALPLRFAALPAGGRLSVGETGFGTGLNFLCAWQLFERTAPADARLHFVSVEKYPLTRADLQKALALWPELAPWADALLAQYVAVHPGFQRFVFADGRVVLTLLVGDVLERLPELDARIDAWFLDGFAPAKNPEMWTPALFAELARLSAPGASLATFTSAGFVRRGLNAAGFAMQRVKGFGQKREMLAGRFEGTPQEAAKPWFARPPRPAGPREALVIGAGLAGCAAAASLACRGWQVTLLERRAAVAEETSGNPQGVLYLKLSAHGTALSRLIVAGFGFTRRLLQRLEPGRDWSPCGVLQLAFDAREAARQAELAAAFPADLLRGLGREEAEELAGVALDSGGLFYPEAGWVHPPALCAHLAAHPNIRLLTHREVLDLHREDGQWCARAGETLLARAPVAVLAGGAEIARFPEAAGLPLKRIRGQISRLPATAASRDLQTVLCAEGYVAPVRDGEHTLGASFRFDSDELVLTAEEHAENLQLLREISTDLAERLQADRLVAAELEGRAGFRCTSPDYLPIAGPLADAAAFAEAYAVLGKDARQVPQHPCPWLDGLYVSSGHGSRGLLSAPLAGELLAAWLDDEPLPVPRAVAEACHPNRFGLRRLIRGK
ncbi:bifunctional tRNA (5-methylaminomethyl-2-thiouridine)(34)-methyltransferase MnmD/FAD-dependent 5-carboxymethylaminomethyl-2-thiouridine(34) oxidoreductase MnmC [Azotobacter chroococcum subsp. isscasi]|uniref:bifunctional tRNA (5-methylaminomethyl-2-thiouridine)(34)-methyltransferase MnmD/FAD-dependent 5-carboxymethylaminomethyl-2-thiouridine(34) oxidoreductase MnmC n=1 Tax=Azotobacter chroococcum TaxID=353 RepID=UPI001038A5E9|nr:bifunctional tRNA (5-methylaminomethyl-2-thiouridine)(34)-methyltransferase MnmD/FAD-dependent 5-carboxymethylaminomethyl-2-thiouridine(34) oxidoreductase MnmC [Azotobacter chroococcum]TBW10416.1 bifunctional tRNA (5-methylaminomethyl-2-thiouridine)(34)-methyltransferase MnmD/FAD-dependent 5-carboxymethylaminomethyl-2-thiouridine(34) oxidoreductase MnmC [Azotobacter chroococcum subsp. isscasi]